MDNIAIVFKQIIPHFSEISQQIVDKIWIKYDKHDLKRLNALKTGYLVAKCVMLDLHFS